jgi:hypothetical protein
MFHSKIQSSEHPELPYMFRGVQLHPMVVASLVLQLFLFMPTLLNAPPFANLSLKVWQLSGLLASFIAIGTILGYVSQSFFHPIRFCRQHPVEIAITTILFVEMCLPAGGLSH